MHEALKCIGVNPDEYGLHSLRLGGVPMAAAAGVPDRPVQRQEGRRSDAMQAYIQESLPNLPQVFQVLTVVLYLPCFGCPCPNCLLCGEAFVCV